MRLSGSGRCQDAVNLTRTVQVEELLRARLRAARAEFGRGFDPDVTAHTIMVVHAGLLALAHQRPDAKQAKAVIEQVMGRLA